MNIIDAMDDPQLFAAWFKGPSWRAWRVALKAIFALPMTDAETAIYRAATGRTAPPASAVQQSWICAGRRAGKSLIAALVAVFLACFRSYEGQVAPGEIVTIMIVSADRKQARTVMRYVRAFLLSTPLLAAMVLRETRDSIELSNGVVIEIHTASRVSTRSYTLGGIINDEISFWPTDENAARLDSEILTAQQPGLATIRGSVMLNISSPYARVGSMYSAFVQHYGKDDSDVLFWKAASRSIDPECRVEMNPSIDRRVVEAAFDADAASAQSEWHADFRTDVEKLFTIEALEACTDYDLPDVVPFDVDEVSEWA